MKICMTDRHPTVAMTSFFVVVFSSSAIVYPSKLSASIKFENKEIGE